MRSIFVTTLLLSGVGCATPPAEDDSWDFSDGKGDGQAGLSYGQLARSKVTPAFEALEVNLKVIDADILPHEAKPVRKQVAELRDYIDLFVYAYSDKNGDPWQDIREDYDVGYETMGEFKDLFDRQGVEDPAEAEYDDDEVAELRDDLRDWYKDHDKAHHDERAYLAEPQHAKLFVRDRKDLSPFFWGATKLEPTKSKSGLKNMAKLTRELTDLAIDDYDKVLDVRDLHVEKNQVKFHDFRKRVRSLARMPGYFPEIMDADADITDDAALIAEAVERYGSINDKITKYAHAPKKALENEIRADWRALRSWQTEHDFDQVLERFHDAVRN